MKIQTKLRPFRKLRLQLPESRERKLDMSHKDVKIINVSTYPITFSRDNKGGDTFVVPPSKNLVLGRLTQVDIPVPPGSPRRIHSGCVATEPGLTTLERLEAENPGAVIVGSMRAAEAYPGRVMYPVPVEGYETMHPSLRVMRCDVFVQRVAQIPVSAAGRSSLNTAGGEI